jgi:hypothetical protein
MTKRSFLVYEQFNSYSYFRNSNISEDRYLYTPAMIPVPKNILLEDEKFLIEL